MKWVRRIGRGLPFVARYLLAVGMMPYGISKLFQAQFQLFASSYTAELGSLNGATLAWAFLGRSPWLQVLLGVTEVIPAALLLFRRTKTLGAVLMLPPALGVFLVNFALELWPETRLVSAALLALDVVVLAAEWRTVRDAVRALLGAPAEKTRWRRVELGFGVVVLVAALGGTTALLRSMMGAQTMSISDFVGDRQINGAGAWMVERVAVGDEAAPGAGTRVHFDFDRHCLIEPMSGDELARLRQRSEARRQCKYVADRSARTFELHSGATGGGPLDELKGTYEATQDRLTLTGAQDGKTVQVVLRPLTWETRPAGSAATSAR
jgi:hypothetical protein